jgi:hypothetical protein
LEGSPVFDQPTWTLGRLNSRASIGAFLARVSAMPQRKGPTDAQLEAAIEGAKDMPEVSKTAARLAESTTDPSEETGGPRTSGGLTNPGNDTRAVEAVEPEEALKRETALFQPGTQRKAM